MKSNTEHERAERDPGEEEMRASNRNCHRIFDAKWSREVPRFVFEG